MEQKINSNIKCTIASYVSIPQRMHSKIITCFVTTSKQGNTNK